MYQIWITNDCPKGWAYVRDYQCNLIFYGTIEECHQCIDDLMGFGTGGEQ